MTPSASASPIVLLAPAAAPASAPATGENASLPALDGGFQLLIDVAAQQQLAAQFGNPTAKPSTSVAADGGELPIAPGNGLPLTGLMLPVDGDQALAPEDETTKSDTVKKEGDGTQALADGAIPLPWVPVNIQAPPPQPATTAGTHAAAAAAADTDAAISTAALAQSGNKAPVAGLTQTADPTKPADGIQLGAGNPAASGGDLQNGQAGAGSDSKPAGDALATVAATDKKIETTPDNGAAARKAGEVASFADALKPAIAAQANSSPTPTPIGAVDGSRAQQVTRPYLENNSAATATVAVPVGSNGWSDAVVDKVMWFSANQLNSAEIKLNPPDLGPLQVRISTQHDQTTVVFSSPHAAVRDALDQALPRLRDMFGGQGLQLSDASVGGQAQRQQQGGENGAPGQNRNPAWFGSEDTGDTPVAVTRVVGSRLSTSAVDAYA